MYQIILAFITSILLCWLSIPSVIRISKRLHIYDGSCDRKIHEIKTSRLGGISIFFSMILSLCFWSNQLLIVELQYIITAIIILFLMGLKDDLLGVRAYKKLLIQIFASLIIVYFTNIKLTTFYGLFGITDISPWLSFVLSTFVFVSITNSFNLIDGVDGLATSVALFASLCFSTWFFLVGSYQFAILGFTLSGSLLGFLFFNWNPARIFMGDSGSLTVGFIVSLLAIQFIEMNRILERTDDYKILSVPVITIAILVVPIFDTIRVFFCRIFLQRKSPFSPDRTHLHHLLLDSGMNVKKVVATVMVFNIFVAGTAFILKGKISGEFLLIVILLEIILFMVFVRNLGKKYKNKA